VVFDAAGGPTRQPEGTLASAAEQRDAVAESLDTLGYLLDMARLEAESTAQAGARRN